MKIDLEPDLGLFSVRFCIEESTPLLHLLGAPSQKPPLLRSYKTSLTNLVAFGKLLALTRIPNALTRQARNTFGLRAHPLVDFLNTPTSTFLPLSSSSAYVAALSLLRGFPLEQLLPKAAWFWLPLGR